MNQHHFQQKETSMDSTLPYQSHFGYSIAEMGGWSYNSSITPMKQIEGELNIEVKNHSLKWNSHVTYKNTMHEYFLDLIFRSADKCRSTGEFSYFCWTSHLIINNLGTNYMSFHVYDIFTVHIQVFIFKLKA